MFRSISKNTSPPQQNVRLCVSPDITFPCRNAQIFSKRSYPPKTTCADGSPHRRKECRACRYGEPRNAFPIHLQKMVIFHGDFLNKHCRIETKKEAVKSERIFHNLCSVPLYEAAPVPLNDVKPHDGRRRAAARWRSAPSGYRRFRPSRNGYRKERTPAPPKPRARWRP